MQDNTNKGRSDADRQPESDPDDYTGTRPRREPVFTVFDEEDYEEPERDTDYASRYLDDDVDDELEEADEFDAVDEPETYWREEEEEHEPDDEELEPVVHSDPPWEQEEGDNEYAEETSRWPVGLLAAGLLAIVLLAAGGYGVLQQRAATAEEIRQLRAQLATASQPVETPVDTAALAEARKRNVELSMAMESLKLENQRLLDTVAGLEVQLEAQQEALAKPAPPPPTPTPAPPEPKAAPVAGTSAGSEAPGSWFVNFGSYSQRGMADSWAARLKPDTGRAVVTTGSRDGKTFYRVRVIELADRATADRVARQLESEYGLSKLWVGK